jgi:hypothetical protein
VPRHWPILLTLLRLSSSLRMVPAQQRAEPIGLGGGEHAELVAAAEQDRSASQSPSAQVWIAGRRLGAARRAPLDGRQSVGLALPAAGLAVGCCSHPMTVSPAAATARAARHRSCAYLRSRRPPAAQRMVDDPGLQLGKA